MRSSLVLLLYGALAAAQTNTACRPGVTATGEADLSAPAEQARVSVGVVTQAGTAEEAGSQNAAQLTAVIASLRGILGEGADIHTASYTVNPNYHTPDGAAPMIIGYTASNTLQVKIDDLSLVGRVLDAVTQNGANNVNGITFGLRNEDQLRLEALKQAARQARANAEAMAGALGVRVVGLQSAETSGLQVPRPMMAFSRAARTPIEPGSVEVHAHVQVTLDVAP